MPLPEFLLAWLALTRHVARAESEMPFSALPVTVLPEIGDRVRELSTWMPSP